MAATLEIWQEEVEADTPDSLSAARCAVVASCCWWHAVGGRSVSLPTSKRSRKEGRGPRVAARAPRHCSNAPRDVYRLFVVHNLPEDSLPKPTTTSWMHNLAIVAARNQGEK
jgi:hypothetical protein